MAEYREQEKDLIYALDIGTRSVVGVVGKPAGDRFEVLDIEIAEHGKRAMMDGQIDDIRQVSGLVRTVTERLEKRLEVSLRRVCVAAAGRALRTQKGSFMMELDPKKPMDAEQISRLEAGAVSVAEEALHGDEDERKQFFLVGYTVAQYRMDYYPLNTLLSHSGEKAEADIVATFLPGEVVESLYATMRGAGLQVASMTLEPIAAMNAAIPADLRLLNLALVDIGAGTTDIAICREGSVVGYTMVTVAGDEITEALMHAFLVDFSTAEQIKRALTNGEQICYTDILGLENILTAEEVMAAIATPMAKLAQAIAKQVSAINDGAPSALFLAGGGSKLNGLCGLVAKELGMEPRRVALAGSNFAKSAFSEEISLENPEYATPLGIAVSAGLGLLNDSYVVLLNGEPAKLFRSGVLALRDILLMNGYSYTDMVGRTGKSLRLTLDGRPLLFRGEPSAPAILQVNGDEATLATVIHAGDRIDFVPAKAGADASRTLGQLIGWDFRGRALVNNVEAPLETQLRQGDVVLALAQPAPVRREVVVDPPVEVAPAAPQPPVAPVQPAPKEFHVILNGEPLTLPGKPDGAPYYLMDLLQHSGLDFENLDRPVRLEVNGVERGFQYVLRGDDTVSICCV